MNRNDTLFMRYFIELSYRGTAYCGWQKQPAAPSIQQTIEESLQKILRRDVPVVGCGRTDTGVHAHKFYLHFDTEEALPDNFLSRSNKVLPRDIGFKRIIPVHPKAHTRFDATRRAYQYHLGFHKNPFTTHTTYHFPQAQKLNFDRMQEAAQLLLNYSAFYTFCKSNTEVKTMNCTLFRSEWEWTEDQQGLIFHIAADRFLRGMVRLIVGMCINVGMGKLKLTVVKKALDQQVRLTKSLSAPAHGLFLTEVDYDYI